MAYSITVGKRGEVEPTPERLYHQLGCKHAAAYAATVIGEADPTDDLTMTIWDGTTEAVDIKLLVGTAKVWVDADVYSAKPRETAYIKAAVDNAVSEWRVRRSEVRPG
jgi:hypothetical protein